MLILRRNYTRTLTVTTLPPSQAPTPPPPPPQTNTTTMSTTTTTPTQKPTSIQPPAPHDPLLSTAHHSSLHTPTPLTSGSAPLTAAEHVDVEDGKVETREVCVVEGVLERALAPRAPVVEGREDGNGGGERGMGGEPIGGGGVGVHAVG